MSKHCLWIHGVESDNFNPQNIIDCTKAVSVLLKAPCDHTIFNWNVEVQSREDIVYGIVQARGNYLTRKIRRAICLIACDMWWTLQMLKGGQPSYMMDSIMKKLDELVIGIIHKDKDAQIYLICHSWGNFMGLNYLINHPEVQAGMISMGDPLFYGSGAFEDWGDPDKITNLLSWLEIGIPSDPISTFMTSNPNPKWSKKVRSVDIPIWNPLPLDSHCAYWSNKKVQQAIAGEISA